MNKSLISDEPPFEPGDLIVSVTDDHTTARRGRRFYVSHVYWTAKGWRVEVEHPYSRFAGTSYYCRKFRLVHSKNQSEEKQKEISMYIAIDADVKNPGDLTPNNMRNATYVAMDTTLDRGFKQQVETYLANHPDAQILVFSLDKMVELERQPIIWKNMR